METSRSSSRQGRRCPVLCVTKAVLFVVINVAALFVPLGDPKKVCSPGGYGEENPVLFNLCKAYNLYEKLTDIFSDIVSTFFCAVSDAVHNAKMKFNSVLTTIDKENVCSSVCCPSEVRDCGVSLYCQKGDPSDKGKEGSQEKLGKRDSSDKGSGSPAAKNSKCICACHKKTKR